MISKLKNCDLFNHMSEEDIAKCLNCSKSKVVSYQKDESIFLIEDKPTTLFILLEGVVTICRDSVDGKRNIITTIADSGEMFGEVFLFLNKDMYDNYAIATNDVKVLEMPKDYLYLNCANNCGFHTLLISNMLSILAQKAYFLNQKLNVVSSQTLRQKICKLLFHNVSENGEVTLNMNREELADFLNVARPSLSRELMKMQEEGLIKIDKKKFKIIDIQKIKNIL